jgi:hypothetical protein
MLFSTRTPTYTHIRHVIECVALKKSSIIQVGNPIKVFRNLRCPQEHIRFCVSTCSAITQASWFFCVPWAKMKIMFGTYPQNVKMRYVERCFLLVNTLHRIRDTPLWSILGHAWYGQTWAKRSRDLLLATCAWWGPHHFQVRQGCLWGGPPALAARPVDMPDRPSCPPGTGQTGVDWQPW